MNCYIYYRVATTEHAAFLAEIQQLSVKLLAAGLSQPQLLRKMNDPANAAPSQLPTWMEIYTDVEEDFLPTLAALITSSEMPILFHSARHVERFEVTHINSA
jgi:hypothetical protein